MHFVDVWDRQMMLGWSCIDEGVHTSSKLLVVGSNNSSPFSVSIIRLFETTRIKGLLHHGGVQVKLELLDLKESVELLARVAELDGAQLSPVCVEIVLPYISFCVESEITNIRYSYVVAYH